jgi:hypothetical protein
MHAPNAGSRGEVTKSIILSPRILEILVGLQKGHIV